MKTEQQIQKEIVDYLRKEGHYVIKVEKATEVGVADLVVCSMYGGKFYAIEVKRPDKRKNTSKLQDLHLELVRNSGGRSFVATDVWDVMEQDL